MAIVANTVCCSLYLEYRKPHVITVGIATIILLSLSLHEKEAKQFSHISYSGDLLPVYTHSSGSKLVGN